MNTRAIVSLSLSALMLGGSMVVFVGGSTGMASASDHSQSAAEKTAADNASHASKALSKRDTDSAIRFAEGAVALMPSRADYRVLLGQSYLQAGRFTSARQAFADALQLSPDNGKAALNYALAQTATGDWDGARKTLDSHAASIPASDRGLATALAGDPVTAVSVLTEAARSPGADAKTRQNLALALALAGQWQMAKVVAEADMSPADVDKRMMEWASFAQPQSASDQVSALLGVAPVQDAGQPVALALNAPAAPLAMAEAVSAPAPAPAPTVQVATVAAPVMVEAPAQVAAIEAPTPVAVAAIAPTPAVAKISFGPRSEVAQVVPAAMIRPAVGSYRLATPKPAVAKAPTKGEFYVQLGAYDSPGVARDGWARATRRYSALGKYVPAGMSITTKTGNFYRLSIGGFVRRDADAMCHGYRAHGGICFVRAGAGDQVALWMRKAGVQIASR